MVSINRTRPIERIPRKDLALLGGIVVYVIVTFLPWTYSISIAGVGLIAWLMLGLMLLAPLAGLILTLLDKDDEPDLTTTE